MSQPKPHEVEDYLDRIYNSKTSDFYRRLWKDLPQTLAEVNILKTEQLVETGLYSRLYREEPGLVKTVMAENGQPFLVKRGWSDIRLDKLPIKKDDRVFVLMDNTEEGLEYSLSVYEHDAIPYLGDLHNLEVTLSCASQFKVTTLICDLVVWRRLVEADLIPMSVESIIIIDRSLKPDISPTMGSRSIKTFLALPESGLIGEVIDSAVVPAFGTHIESIDNKCVITKPGLITPLIRYQTDISCAIDDQRIVIRT